MENNEIATTLTMSMATSNTFNDSAVSEWKQGLDFVSPEEHQLTLPGKLLVQRLGRYLAVPTLTQEDADSVLIARKLGNAGSFNSIRYYVDGDDNLIRDQNGVETVIAGGVTNFEIQIGLDTTAPTAGGVLAADLDGYVSRSFTADPFARWIDDIGGADDAELVGRHAIGIHFLLEHEVSKEDVQLEEKKTIRFESQVRLGNSLPKGSLAVYTR